MASEATSETTATATVLRATERQIRLRLDKAHGDREVEAGARLAHVRGREVDRRFVHREPELAVVDRRPDAFLRFADRRVGQTDDRDVRPAVVFALGRRKVYLDVHNESVDAVDGSGLGQK